MFSEVGYDIIKIMQRGFSPITVLIGVIVIMLLAGGLFYVNRLSGSKSQSSEVTSQTQTPQVTTNGSFTSSPSTEQVNNINEISNWKTFTHYLLNFSVKYPSDVLTPKFATNVGVNDQSKPVAFEYRIANERYKDKGFDNAGDLNLGKLEITNNNSVGSTGYDGIGFTSYYIGNKDIDFLKDYFKTSKNFTITLLNGKNIGVYDQTKNIVDGYPPSYAKYYYFKIGANLLRVGTGIYSSTPEDQRNQVFSLLDKISTTITYP
ncbi:MAG: hypothetical protein HYS83_00210 [Candidatus Blackburnbacteria bacterium]|nr:hypothetical protein [Candidatus Blackburnbacteria bacterium]